MADVKATVTEYRNKAEAKLQEVKQQVTEGSSEAANVAKTALNELRGAVKELATAVKNTAQQQIDSAKAGGDIKAQLQRQKDLVGNYAEPLKAAGNNVSAIAANVKSGLVSAAK